ncbi:MAG: hypothetical protein JO132_00625 [Streptosporangiaceae bacterium]|nr:hypothetical protein [Streptosporangiaceae bacterium]
MRTALGEAAFGLAWADGRTLPTEEAAALALEDADAVRHGQWARVGRRLLAWTPAI